MTTDEKIKSKRDKIEDDIYKSQDRLEKLQDGCPHNDIVLVPEYTGSSHIGTQVKACKYCGKTLDYVYPNAERFTFSNPDGLGFVQEYSIVNPSDRTNPPSFGVQAT